MSSWRKFRTYRDLRSRTLNTLYWDGIMYMWWIIGERSHGFLEETLIRTRKPVLSGGNMAVMAAAPVSA